MASADYETWAGMLMKANTNSFGRPDASPIVVGPWSRRQIIERRRQEMMDLARSAPREEGVDIYELSLRDIVESLPSKKAEEERKADEEKDAKRKRVLRKEKERGAGLIIRGFMPSVRAVLRGHRKITDGCGGKGAKVSLKPGNFDCQERSCGDHNAGGRNRGGKASCYLFLQRDRSSRIIEM